MGKDSEKHKPEEQHHKEEKEEQNWNSNLIKAVKEENLEVVKKCIDKGANIFYEEKKWNALLWASYHGHVDVVRYLLEKGAGTPYLEKTATQDHASKQEKEIDQGLINNNARATPLQWACFKGHVHVVWLLLKAGLDVMEADIFGNNAIHQAVSGGGIEVVKTLLQYGIRIDSKNNRGQTVFDLCKDPKVLRYLKEYQSQTHCEGNSKPFGPNETKYLCAITNKYFSKEASDLYWIYANEDAKAEKLERRSEKGQIQIKNIEDTLEEMIRNYSYNQYGTIWDQLDFIEDNNLHIDVNLLHKAKILAEKLETQAHIIRFIDSLTELPDWKAVEKSMNILDQMVSDTKNSKVLLDKDLEERCRRVIDRLFAERNIRIQVGSCQISNSTYEDIRCMEEYKQAAVNNSVASKYCEEADIMMDKMKKSLQVKEIIKKFIDYPERDWYPPLYYIDHKTKKPTDAYTKRPIDPRLLIPPAKKQKKFIIPDWACETRELSRLTKRLEELFLEAKSLELGKDMLIKGEEQIERMKKEFRYRQTLDEEAKIAAEQKAKR